MQKTTRRSFLSKICGLLPFGVGLAVVGRSDAPEGQREGESNFLPSYCGVPKRKGFPFPKAPSTSKDNCYRRYYVRYDFGTKTQTVIEGGEITEARKFKEDPFVLFNPDPTVSYVIFEKYKMV